MARPKLDPSAFDETVRGAVALAAWGRLTAGEVASALGVHPETIRRWSRAFYGRSPSEARRTYVRKLIAQAEGVGKRPLTKAQMRHAQETRGTPDSENHSTING